MACRERASVSTWPSALLVGVPFGLFYDPCPHPQPSTKHHFAVRERPPEPLDGRRRQPPTVLERNQSQRVHLRQVVQPLVRQRRRVEENRFQLAQHPK